MHATGCRSVTDEKPSFWGACRRTLDWFVRPEDAARRDYKLATGRALNLTRPRDLSEKLCWLRLNYDNPLIKECRDIVTMRNYVARTLGPEALAPVIAVLSCARSLSPALVAGRPFDVHVTGGGGRVTVRDPGHADWNSLRSALDKRLEPHASRRGLPIWCAAMLRPVFSWRSWCQRCGRSAAGIPPVGISRTRRDDRGC